MTRRPILLAAAVAVLLTALTAAQTREPQTGTGLIVGQIVDGRSGRPVSGAIVGISGAGNARPRILTGSSGRFVFRDLPRGNFTITATKPGYAPGAFGRRRPEGPSLFVTLGPDERLGDVTIPIWKHAAIGGMVMDETGEPVARVQVRAWRRTVVAGQPRLAPRGTALTDDRGLYRIGSLVPGDYVVGAAARHVVAPMGADVVSWGPLGLQARDFTYRLGGGTITPPPPGDQFLLYPPTYFAGASDTASAIVIAVGSGEERLSVDLQAHPVPTARVSGTLTSPDGNVAFQTVRLVPEGSLTTNADEEAPAVASDGRGGFIFPAVPPGRYTLRSTTTATSSLRPGAALVWAAVPLQVGSTNIDGLTVPLLPGLRISGRVEFEGTSPWPSPAQLARIPLVVEPADGDSELGPIPGMRVNDAGEFASGELVGGRYVLRVTDSPVGWMFKSATFGGRDISSSPIDLNGYDASGVVITFTDRWSGLNGMVQNRSRNPDPDALVVVFPADRQMWTAYGFNSRRLRGVRTGRYGEYAFATLPPGDYYVAAIPDDKADGWQDPDVLEQLARDAARVGVAEGERRRQDLRTRELR